MDIGALGGITGWVAKLKKVMGRHALCGVVCGLVVQCRRGSSKCFRGGLCQAGCASCRVGEDHNQMH